MCGPCLCTEVISVLIYVDVLCRMPPQGTSSRVCIVLQPCNYSWNRMLFSCSQWIEINYNVRIEKEFHRNYTLIGPYRVRFRSNKPEL